ncbi:MAG: hypothetical protein J6386_08580 [Candidatus Synoicihabitans palmerolidicus]|nr:hypothetical protein [Candidatus Synoicihabitans palmerolidicus]
MILPLRETRDLGFLPEGKIHRRAQGDSPYDWARRGENYPIDRIMPVALAATNGTITEPSTLQAQFADPEAAIRYWTLFGLSQQPLDGITAQLPSIAALLNNEASSVQILAATLLVRYGDDAIRTSALNHLAYWADPHGDHFKVMAALAAIDALNSLATPVHDLLREYPRKTTHLPHRRYQHDVDKLIAHIQGAASNAPRLN